MAIKEVKAGEKYKLELLCIHNSGKVIIFETPTGDHLPFRESDLECVSPARQDVLPEHSTVATLSYPERVWNELCDGVFDDDGQKYAADLSKAMRNHIKSMNPDTANGTKNTETAPKYDPCRKFRKGDRVRVAENKGRCLKPYSLKIGDVLTVSMDEPNDDTCVIGCKWHDRDFYLDPAYLELVTPVEEMEPYFVEHYKHSNAYKIRKGGQEFAIFWDIHPHAKEAAEAERDRLNAEYRKEQE